jgi:hypothetical protein
MKILIVDSNTSRRNVTLGYIAENLSEVDVIYAALTLTNWVAYATEVVDLVVLVNSDRSYLMCADADVRKCLSDVEVVFPRFILGQPDAAWLQELVEEIEQADKRLSS